MELKWSIEVDGSAVVEVHNRRWRVYRATNGNWLAIWKPLPGYPDLSPLALRCVGGFLRTAGKRPRQAWFHYRDAAQYAVELHMDELQE